MNGALRVLWVCGSSSCPDRPLMYFFGNRTIVLSHNCFLLSFFLSLHLSLFLFIYNNDTAIQKASLCIVFGMKENIWYLFQSILIFYFYSFHCVWYDVYIWNFIYKCMNFSTFLWTHSALVIFYSTVYCVNWVTHVYPCVIIK